MEWKQVCLDTMGRLAAAPNQRLELTPPSKYGRMAFVNTHVRRRSSAAPR